MAVFLLQDCNIRNIRHKLILLQIKDYPVHVFLASVMKSPLMFAWYA